MEVAEQICYDGTPAHSERAWAVQNGWIAREFTVTWESAAALLDRGMPFTFTTVAPGTAHLQAVIGYDSRRGTLLTRDPSQRLFGEALGEELLESLRSTGPRGMAMAPAERAELLAGIELPDADLFDRYYDLQQALERHERSAAQAAYDALLELAPNHRLTINGRLALSRYDADMVTSLECIEALLEQFPDDGNLLLGRLFYLRELGQREERLALLQRLCESDKTDPLFWRNYAEELSYDARRHAEAERLARRAFRYRPDGRSLTVLANIAWDAMRREEALELYRFAACLDERDEDIASSYFVASRHFRRFDETLRFLRDRFERFGGKSNWPARTLYRALHQLGRSRDAIATIEKALKRRPDDGDLQLFAAECFAQYGLTSRAEAMLKAARKNSHANQWRRTAALLASNRGDTAEALEHWRAVLELEPLASDANDSVAQLLADTAGEDQAKQFLRDAVGRFPNHYSLRVLYIEWLRREDPAEAEAAVREMLTLHSSDPWARRELALLLLRQGKLDEAAAECETAAALDPTHPAVFMIRARLSQKRGRAEEAKEHYRAAIRTSVDYEQAIAGLIEVCDTKAERKQELRFIQRELERQVILGDALATYRDYAAETLKPAELLRSLQECLKERPDLWSAWSVLIRQLVYMDRLEDAAKISRRATDRFPLIPSLWLDVAAARRAAGDSPGEIQAIGRALRISPSWSSAARMLSEAYERQGDYAKSHDTLRQAVARDPGNAQNHGCLADALWHLERKEEALAEIRLAARLESRYDWAWDRLREWSAALEQPRAPVDLARECAKRGPTTWECGFG